MLYLSIYWKVQWKKNGIRKKLHKHRLERIVRQHQFKRSKNLHKAWTAAGVKASSVKNTRGEAEPEYGIWKDALTSAVGFSHVRYVYVAFLAWKLRQ